MDIKIGSFKNAVFTASHDGIYLTHTTHTTAIEQSKKLIYNKQMSLNIFSWVFHATAFWKQIFLSSEHVCSQVILWGKEEYE